LKKAPAQSRAKAINSTQNLLSETNGIGMKTLNKPRTAIAVAIQNTNFVGAESLICISSKKMVNKIISILNITQNREKVINYLTY
jgi:hypothetical protein